MSNKQIFLANSAEEYIRSFIVHNLSFIKVENLNVQISRHLGIEKNSGKAKEVFVSGPGVGISLDERKNDLSVQISAGDVKHSIYLNGFEGIEGKWVIFYRSSLQIEKMELFT